MTDKVYILIAGVNGAGKSTFYHSDYHIGDFFEFCDSASFQNIQRVNADEILREFGDWRNPKDGMEAGRIAVKKVRKFFRDGVSFCQETTLCGRGIVRNIVTAKANGYKVGIIYVGIQDSDLAVARVAQRVRNGGHGVEPADIRRRYYESLSNLNAVMSQCDGVLFFDNTAGFRSVAVYNGHQMQLICDRDLAPAWFREYVSIPEPEHNLSKGVTPANIHTKRNDNKRGR